MNSTLNKLTSKQNNTSATKELIRAESPQDAGVSASSVQALVDDLISSNAELHSLMVIRNDVVAVEAYSEPFRKSSVHMMYSVSKSFLSVAYGFALNEGLLSKQTRFLDVFPELKPKKHDPYLEKLTVYQLFNMTAGKRTHRIGRNRLRSFVRAKWDFEPGTSFRYVNENYSAAAAVLARVTGQTITQYLTDRLYKPLGIDPPFWETCGDSIEAGGWGLMLTTEDFAKFLLCMHNGGKLFGKQIIPPDFAREAVSFIADSSVSQTDPDSAAGYGLGFWRCAGHKNTFRCEGLFSQYGISFPDENACIIMTCSSPFLQKTLDIIWRHADSIFTPLIGGSENGGVVIPPSFSAVKSRRSSLEERISKKIYHLTKPLFIDACGYPTGILPMQTTFFSPEKGGDISKIKFSFSADAVTVEWSEKNKFKNSVTLPFNGTLGYSDISIGEFNLKTAGYARWLNNNMLEITVKPIPAVTARRFVFNFQGIFISMKPSTVPDMSERTEVTAKKLKAVLKGRYFDWWIKILTPRVSKILQPTQRGIAGNIRN